MAFCIHIHKQAQDLLPPDSSQPGKNHQTLQTFLVSSRIQRNLEMQRCRGGPLTEPDFLEKICNPIQVVKKLLSAYDERFMRYPLYINNSRMLAANWLLPWLSIHLHVSIFPLATPDLQPDCSSLRHQKMNIYRSANQCIKLPHSSSKWLVHATASLKFMEKLEVK